MTEEDRLIAKHRANGLLIDSNLLVLLLVGRANPARIANFKRTSAYDRADYRLLEEFISVFDRRLTTPHILTEVSNLVSLSGGESVRARALTKDFVEMADELFESSRVVVKDHVFPGLGLTDDAIAKLGANALVITDDFALYGSLAQRGIDTINFSQMRSVGWRLNR